MEPDDLNFTLEEMDIPERPNKPRKPPKRPAPRNDFEALMQWLDDL
jgi:hypothetical protein